MQYLTMREAAIYCGKKYETFRYYVKMKRGPQSEKLGERELFTKDELDQWKPIDRRKK